MATATERTTDPASRTPDVYTADPAGLRAFLWDLLRRGEYVALVTWIVGFVERLWKIQSDLLERDRAHKRRQSPSERLSALQAALPGLFGPAANDASAPKPPARQKKRRGAKKPRPHGRAAFPASLERVPDFIPVLDDQRRCPRCEVPLTAMDVEVSSKLERIPERYVVIETQREKLSCPCCREHIVTAEKPDEIVDRGTLGEQLLVHAAVEHYQDAVPFERLARNARVQGAPVSANTLARGVGKLVDLLDPVVRHIFAQCVASGVVGTDATSMPVLDDDLPRGIRKGALWNLLGDNRWSYFGYAPSGHDTHLAEITEGITLDVLQCDGSATINVLEEHADVRAGCHAHARSKIVAAVRGKDPRAVEGLRVYAELFAIEARSKSAGKSTAVRESRSDGATETLGRCTVSRCRAKDSTREGRRVHTAAVETIDRVPR